MNFVHLILILSILSLGIFLYKVIHNPLIHMCEVEKCPYCYGTDFCDEVKQNKLVLSDSSIFNLFANYFSVKNVFYALYNNNSVVLKKLAHNFELDSFDELICRKNNLNKDCDLLQLIEEQNTEMPPFNFTISNSNERNFKVCSAGDELWRSLISNYRNRYSSWLKIETYARHLWTSLELNAEPVLIQLLRYEDNWPVPQYLGACGRLIVENHCGSNLNDFAEADWNIRANLTLQLLQAAKNFTERHDKFRFYLTDVSPDNIAVNSELRVTFVDLGNVILTSNNKSGNVVHHSIDFDEPDNFAFSEQSICQSTLSDHNYYAVCKLLLSRNAPWPMMEGGLLHHPPNNVLNSFPDLFDLIQVCAFNSEEMNRFEAVENILNILQKILHKQFPSIL